LLNVIHFFTNFEFWSISTFEIYKEMCCCLVWSVFISLGPYFLVCGLGWPRNFKTLFDPSKFARKKNIFSSLRACFSSNIFLKKHKKSKISYLKKMQNYIFICVHIELEPKYQISATLRSIWRLQESWGTFVLMHFEFLLECLLIL